MLIFDNCGNTYMQITVGHMVMTNYLTFAICNDILSVVRQCLIDKEMQITFEQPTMADQNLPMFDNVLSVVGQRIHLCHFENELISTINSCNFLSETCVYL